MFDMYIKFLDITYNLLLQKKSRSLKIIQIFLLNN